MIVTCPGCGSKYRVRDEAVPPGGAELKCPSCGAVFVAHPPKHSDEEIASALERITKAKDLAEKKLLEADAASVDSDRRLNDAERRAREAEARVQQLEAQLIVLRSELQGMQVDARSQFAPLESELARLRDENARLMVRANGAQDAEMRLLGLTEDLARARAAANHAPEVERLNDELFSAQKTTGRLYTDLEEAKNSVQRLEAELARAKNGGASSGEVQRLRDELARAAQMTPGGGIPGNLGALVSAVGPMLWGLEQAIRYLEPFGANEAALAAHVKQLQLLEKVLQRIAKDSGAS